MVSRTFLRFEEIEHEILNFAPPIVYKYRSWKDENHKRLIKNQEVWFSHPFDLNDPLDVRPDTEFDLSEINDQRYLQKLYDSVSRMKPELNTDYERKIVAENQWELTKENPRLVIENHETYNHTPENFDFYGVFSTGTNELNKKLWAEYADNYCGYCVGFKTVELCRDMKSSYGNVTYSDAPFNYSFLKNEEDVDLERLYLKKIIWSSEEEFRFITVGIGRYSNRLQKFRAEVVSEIILGYNMPKLNEEEILEATKFYYPHIPTYKLKKEDHSLFKERIY